MKVDNTPWCFFKKNWLGNTCKGKFNIFPRKFVNDKTSCSTITIDSNVLQSSTLINFFENNTSYLNNQFNLQGGSLIIRDNINDITLDNYFIKKYFNMYCNNRGLNTENCNIKVFFLQSSLSSIPDIEIQKIIDFINEYFSNVPIIKNKLLSEIRNIQNKLYNKSFINGIDLGLVHTALGFFNSCDIEDNKFDISKMICTIELWGEGGDNLFLYQLLPYITNINNLDYNNIPWNTINMVVPSLFGCNYKDFYTNTNGEIHFQNSIYIGNTNLKNILDMFEYSKIFCNKYPYYTTITLDNNPGINCDYFGLSMINFLQQNDNNFTNNDIIKTIKCPFIQLKSNKFTNITNDIQLYKKNIEKFTALMNNIFGKSLVLNTLFINKKNIINIGNLSYLLTNNAHIIIEILNLYVYKNLPFDRSYYVIYSENKSDSSMKLARIKNVNLFYYYDNRLPESIIKF
jgi:hypothetical protein